MTAPTCDRQASFPETHPESDVPSEERPRAIQLKEHGLQTLQVLFSSIAYLLEDALCNEIIPWLYISVYSHTGPPKLRFVCGNTKSTPFGGPFTGSVFKVQIEFSDTN